MNVFNSLTYILILFYILSILFLFSFLLLMGTPTDRTNNGTVDFREVLAKDYNLRKFNKRITLMQISF